jgi:uncharacterized membrane protein
VGLLGNWFVSRRMLDQVDSLFASLPFIKIIYNTIKETMNAFLGKRSSFARVVMINLPGDNEIKVLGFITTDDLRIFDLEDHVAVYVLQSMQWAGFTFLVPKSRIKYLNISPEKALQFIVSAGMASQKNS